MKQPENALIVKQGEGQQDAVPLGAGIFMSRGISNSYLITTPDGDLLTNTGMHFEAAEIQLKMMATGAELIEIPDEVCRKTVKQYVGHDSGRGSADWPAYLRMLDRIDPSYKT